MTGLRVVVLGPLAAAAVAVSLAAQGVVVAPHAVYLDHRARSGSFFLYNPNAEPVEIEIAMAFGYPVTDSSGQMLLHLIEQPGPDARSAAQWIQAFPRRLSLAPLERQTIRLLATPPPGLADGEHWARIVITARGGRVSITGVPDTGNIQVGLNLEIRTIIGLGYRKGAVHTGVRLDSLRAQVEGDTLAAWARLEREGNAAFLGTVRGALVDSAGRLARELFTVPLGVYYTLRPRFTGLVSGLPPGRYWARLEVTTERDDLAPEVVLPAPAVRDSVQVRLP